MPSSDSSADCDADCDAGAAQPTRLTRTGRRAPKRKTQRHSRPRTSDSDTESDDQSDGKAAASSNDSETTPSSVTIMSKSGTRFKLAKSDAQRVTAWADKTGSVITTKLSDKTLITLIRLLKIVERHADAKTQAYWVGKITGGQNQDTRERLLYTTTRLGFPVCIAAGLKSDQEYYSVAAYGESATTRDGALDLANLRIDSLTGLAAVAEREPEVTELYLNHNFLGAVPAEMLGLWRGLTFLSLTHNLLTTLPDLSGLKELQAFNCAHNAFTSLEEGKLHKCRALATVDLEHNKLRSIDPKTLPPHLKFLFAEGNPLDRESKRRLKGKLARQAKKRLEESDHQPTKREITQLALQRSTGLELSLVSRR